MSALVRRAMMAAAFAASLTSSAWADTIFTVDITGTVISGTDHGDFGGNGEFGNLVGKAYTFSASYVFNPANYATDTPGVVQNWIASTATITIGNYSYTITSTNNSQTTFAEYGMVNDHPGGGRDAIFGQTAVINHQWLGFDLYSESTDLLSNTDLSQGFGYTVPNDFLQGEDPAAYVTLEGIPDETEMLGKIDTISVNGAAIPPITTAVPEPSTIALFGCSLALLALTKNAKRQPVGRSQRARELS